MLALLAALGVWERPISGLYFKGIIPLRLFWLVLKAVG